MSATPVAAGLVPQPDTLILAASRQRSSGRGVFPAIPEHSPAASGYEAIALSPEASLYSFTIIHPNPKSGERPFVLAYADFAEDVRVFGRLDLPDGVRPRIGMRLRAVADHSPAGGYRFELAEGDA